MTPKYILGFALGLGVFLVPLVRAIQAQTEPAQQSVAQSVAKSEPGTPKAGRYHSEGERLFAQNCSRCHNAPEGFSPRISGTILRHMRVRAQLSAHDEQELLRFLNP